MTPDEILDAIDEATVIKGKMTYEKAVGFLADIRSGVNERLETLEEEHSEDEG